ncbi:MAG: type III pantothenate kinase [Pseudomonadota bacterium]
MTLLLDVGNSSVKWRAGELRGRCEGESVLPDLPTTPAGIWVASVASAERQGMLTELCQQRWQKTPWFARSERSACGVTNSYAEPSRMGVDRWLAMIAAFDVTQSPVCVVDAGSALTIDFVGAGGQHTGGYIIPGQNLMQQALAGGTARVRVGTSGEPSLQPGTSTDEAVGHGLMLAQVGAVAFALEQMDMELKLIFSGGDGASLMRLLGRGGDYREDLVLDGLFLLGTTSSRAGESVVT